MPQRVPLNFQKIRQKQLIKHRNNQQRVYYSGKRKHYTLTTQFVVDKQTQKILCPECGSGRKHDFRLFKESGARVHPNTELLTDTGYLGIKKLYGRSRLPTKSSKLWPLTKEQKNKNRDISSYLVLNKNVIARLKLFKILRDRYRNRRKRFGLRFNVMAGIYNFELNL